MKKIIDSHVHYASLKGFSIKTILNLFEKNNIDFGIISTLDCLEVDSSSKLLKKQVEQLKANKKLLKVCKANNNKFKMLFWIKPLTEMMNQEIEDFYLKNKEFIVGLKIHPFHSKMRIDDPKVEPFLKFANKYKLPILVHTANDEWSKSDFVANIAFKYPHVKFILGHLDLISDHQKALQYIKDIPNLYGDTCWVDIPTIKQFILELGSEKLLFGTDCPIDGNKQYNYDSYQYIFKELKKEFSIKDYNNILYKNAERIFRLKK